MASRKPTFEEVVAELDSMPTEITLQTVGNKSCSSPAWDSRPHRLALVEKKPTIQVMVSDNVWETARLSPPPQLPQPTSTTASKPVGEFETRTSSILFMDVSGWSKLKAPQIHDYVVKAMPQLGEQLKGTRFLNTWGDAIVATFDSAKVAAEVALRLQDFFSRAYPQDGIAEGLSCRVALHAGETIVAQNPLTQKEDIFGDAVHVAARLEPMTEPGYVFCTQSFADRLREVTGAAPKPWPFEPIKLPKGFGTIDVSVVTWPNATDPRPALRLARAADDQPPAPSAQAAPIISDADALMLLESWVTGLTTDRSGQSIPLATVAKEANVPVNVVKRLLPQAASKSDYAKVKVGDAFVQVAVSTFSAAAVVSSPRRGWGEY
jgi:class 3 adenylate cyclase